MQTLQGRSQGSQSQIRGPHALPAWVPCRDQYSCGVLPLSESASPGFSFFYAPIQPQLLAAGANWAKFFASPSKVTLEIEGVFGEND